MVDKIFCFSNCTGISRSQDVNSDMKTSTSSSLERALAFGTTSKKFGNGFLYRLIGCLKKNGDLMFYKKISLIFLITLMFVWSPFSSYTKEIDTEVILTEQDDKILAFSAQENHWVPEYKRLSERILRKKAQGNIGIVVTTKRIIGFSVITDHWTSEDLKINEIIEEILVEGNVASMTTNVRVIGYSAHTGQWIEAP